MKELQRLKGSDSAIISLLILGILGVVGYLIWTGNIDISGLESISPVNLCTTPSCPIINFYNSAFNQHNPRKAIEYVPYKFDSVPDDEQKQDLINSMMDPNEIAKVDVKIVKIEPTSCSDIKDMYRGVEECRTVTSNVTFYSKDGSKVSTVFPFKGVKIKSRWYLASADLSGYR